MESLAYQFLIYSVVYYVVQFAIIMYLDGDVVEKDSVKFIIFGGFPFAAFLVFMWAMNGFSYKITDGVYRRLEPFVITGYLVSVITNIALMTYSLYVVI